MASPSKEENILRIILENSPLKHWHFEEIVKEAKVTRAVANKWIRKYVKEGLLKRVKEHGRFPYFSAGINNPAYIAKKRVFALNLIYDSGLMQHLLSLEKAKAVIIFGSMAKGDWYMESDIDIFIYGSSIGLDKHKYELRLKRNLELHVFETKKDIDEVKTGLIKNIINGLVIKGSIQDFAEVS